ncbi:redoxin domain-containing protein [Nibribacter ruber]|uniref:Redoxin domain-containing protein n=1 Tax=Nibribacter ruber TaxID=2698458 RepID=A0A6P1P2D4_9BACT|nr:thioredoxin family protein [Nibribacter ruber]QHL88558.1 redoxin domain-containing protein [Nibribacter ruber]
MQRQFPLLLLLLSVFALLTSAMVAQNGYQVGDVATDFTLKNVNGQMMSLKDQKNAKGYVVTFTCNTCPFAKLYEDRLIQLHQKYAPLGYPVVAINPNDVTASPGDSFEQMQKRAKDKKFPFAYLQDESQEVTKRFGATRTPHLYILQKTSQGQWKVAYIGALDNNAGDPEKVTERYAENALNSLLANQPIAQTFTKAIGCTIKWRASAQ